MIPLGDVEVREKMSIVPVANRSFLHGDRKPSPTSEKILYATLDSLALKRATLPLQLLPINDDSNATTKATNESMKQGKIHTDMIAKRSSFKVRVNCSLIGVQLPDDFFQLDKIAISQLSALFHVCHFTIVEKTQRTG